MVHHCKLPNTKKANRQTNVKKKITETISNVYLGPIIPRGRTIRGLITPIILWELLFFRLVESKSTAKRFTATKRRRSSWREEGEEKAPHCSLPKKKHSKTYAQQSIHAHTSFVWCHRFFFFVHCGYLLLLLLILSFVHSVWNI